MYIYIYPSINIYIYRTVIYYQTYSQIYYQYYHILYIYICTIFCHLLSMRKVLISSAPGDLLADASSAWASWKDKPDTYPFEKYGNQLGSLFPICGKIKHVPNHRPVLIYDDIWWWYDDDMMIIYRMISQWRNVQATVGRSSITVGLWRSARNHLARHLFTSMHDMAIRKFVHQSPE